MFFGNDEGEEEEEGGGGGYRSKATEEKWMSAQLRRVLQALSSHKCYKSGRIMPEIETDTTASD